MEREHKAFVLCTDKLWREYVASCVRRGVTIKEDLARLVTGHVAKENRERDRAPASAA